MKEAKPKNSKPKPKKEAKLIQIVAAPYGHNSHKLYALDNDGVVWVYDPNTHGWRKLST